MQVDGVDAAGVNGRGMSMDGSRGMGARGANTQHRLRGAWGANAGVEGTNGAICGASVGIDSPGGAVDGARGEVRAWA